MPFRIFQFAFVLLLTACATQEQASDKRNIATADSTITVAQTPATTGPLSSVLSAYYKVKDAFVRTDGTGADMAAMQLRLSVDSLYTQKPKMDSSGFVAITGFKKTIFTAIDGMIKERDMQKKRMQFAMLSDNMYDLVKATPYTGERVYRLHCPMAFDKGADWLSNQAVVANPYFGSKMMDCGEVTDSLMGK